MSSYQSWLAARGYRRATVERSSFGEGGCDSGRHPPGEDAQRLSGEAMPKRPRSGIAQVISGTITHRETRHD